MLYPRRKFLIGYDAVAQLFDFLHKIGMCALESVATALVAGVENRSVGKNYAHRLQHSVAIGMSAAIHARGIVHHYTSHHCRLLRCRVGREYLAVRLQNLVHPLSDDSRLQSYCFGIGRHLIAFPVLPCHNKN